MKATVLSPLALLMLVVAQRREIAKQNGKVTTATLHTRMQTFNWHDESELKACSMNFLDTAFSNFTRLPLSGCGQKLDLEK